jgi:hypothetical protein
MSMMSKIKEMKRLDLASDLFYLVSGIIMLIFTPLINFPPHVALLGVVTLITAYSLLKDKNWKVWLIAIVVITGTVFSVDTMINIGFTNLPLTGLMVAYLVLAWIFTVYLTLLKKE